MDDERRSAYHRQYYRKNGECCRFSLAIYATRGKPRRYTSDRDGHRVIFARAVMGGHLRRHLRAEEVVDHINGDSLDDRLENLKLFASHAEHMREEFRRGRITGLKLGPASPRSNRFRPKTI